MKFASYSLSPWNLVKEQTGNFANYRSFSKGISGFAVRCVTTPPSGLYRSFLRCSGPLAGTGSQRNPESSQCHRFNGPECAYATHPALTTRWEASHG